MTYINIFSKKKEKEGTYIINLGVRGSQCVFQEMETLSHIYFLQMIS